MARKACRNDQRQMIAIDTSALMTIILGEAGADACMRILESETEVLISAGTVAEALIVAARRNVAEEMTKLIDGLGFDIISVTPASARRIAGAYERWGKGVYPAGLNFGDCFAYEVAKAHSCRLLYVGNDFSKTDLDSAL
jgi:ribonuclease VapC